MASSVSKTQLHWSNSTLRKPIPYHRVRAVKIASVGGGVSRRIGFDQCVYGLDLMIKQPVVSKGGSQSKWEDEILSDTVPLVGFVRMVLHSKRYKTGDRLSPDHEKIIVERLLPYHPKYEMKIGCGIDHIKVGYHPDFEGTRCLLIVQKDGGLVDFSYWKCLKSLIRNKYPLYAERFILKHFQRHWRKE